jgi:hypothetical protein
MAKDQYSDSWQLSLTSGNNSYSINNITNFNTWTPGIAQWDSLKLLSKNLEIKFSVKKLNGNKNAESIEFLISKDSVNAPVLYRQMPIPFVFAEKKLDSMSFMLINLGSNKPPHYAMKGFMVCGNCHSFTSDGNTIGLDLDAGKRDKGGYFIAPIKDSVFFTRNNYMSWTKISKGKTFGLFSKVSPDGRYIVTTIKDRVLSKNFPFEPSNIAFSQLFFPVNGHLAIYDRKLHKINELPGADLDEYVQSNATWTPDGKYIVFARAKSLPKLNGPNEVSIQDEKLINDFVERKRSFKYDLCIIPFNNSKGGNAEPIEGASANGKSNYFPAVSPDGKWLVYCQADNFMLLQPDSRLYIVPVKGGKARELRCNFQLMNSWHSWAPNGKWIVFSSKGLSIYTDLFLSHIDSDGNSSAPVLVDKARHFRKVVNYPEFINQKPSKTFDMVYDYVELTHIEMALKNGNIKKAKLLFYRFVEQNQILMADDYYQLSYYLSKMGLVEEAKKYEKLANGL